MNIIGVTGEISVGKTMLSKRVSQRLKYLFWSADENIHNLLMYDESTRSEISYFIPFLKEKNTQAFRKEILKEWALEDIENLKCLEKILHPKVEKRRQKFIQEAKRQKCKGVVLEIPLLFEVGLEKEMDIIILVEAPSFIQRERFLKRAGASLKHAESFQKRLLPLSYKRKKSNIIIKNGLSLNASFFKTMKLLKEKLNKHKCKKII